MLSGTESRVLSFITHSVHQEQFAPTFQEIADGTNLSLSGARFIVLQLEAKGFLRRRDHKFRALQVLKTPSEVAA